MDWISAHYATDSTAPRSTSRGARKGEMRRCRRTIFGPVLIALALAGCATVSPYNQDFLEVQTRHFDIVSSLGEEPTRELVRRLEEFYAAAQFVIGGPIGGKGLERTRVVAFDGRDLDRPFALPGKGAYFLTEPDRGSLIIPAGGGWDRRVPRELRHRVAHRLLRSQRPNLLPLWLEEGIAQVIGATQSYGAQVQVGMPIAPFVREVRDWKNSLRSVIRARDLSETTRPSRDLFDARAWALVHMLRFGSEKRGGVELLRAYLAELDRAGPRSPDREVQLFGGDPDTLGDRMFDYFSQNRYRVMLLDPPPASDPNSVELMPISRAHSRSVLARLALTIGKPKLARKYFERALELEPDRAEALVGLAQAARDAFVEAESLLRRADPLARDDARLQAQIGDAYAAAVGEAEDAVERARRLSLAREHYRRSLSIDSLGIPARVGLGLTYLLAGEDASMGIEWLETAARLRPGSLEIELARARLALKRGRPTSARLRAREVISRSHDRVLIRRAREVLAEAQSARGR